MGRNHENWTRNDYLAAIGRMRGRTSRKKNRRSKKKRLAAKDVLEGVMLGHMLGKNNKNPVQKRALIDTMSSSQMTGMGKVWKAFMSTHYPLPQKQIKQLVKDKHLIGSIFNPKIPVETRRRVLNQKGGIFPALFPIAAKVIGSSLLGPIIGKILK